MSAEPRYFKNPAALRRWYEEHAATAAELVVGFMKTGTGSASVTWPESVDEALCFGWIDGVRHRIDEQRYKIRFTPRKASSHWSDVNIKRVAQLQAEGRMTPAGLAAFARRTETRSRNASYEQEAMPEFSAAQLRIFQLGPAAWRYFETVPPGYRKRVVWWVISAKQLATQEKRLAQLIDACARHERL
jgi:uncharacterized protein YdeI (YjbR/CyaY-like superfamily)